MYGYVIFRELALFHGEHTHTHTHTHTQIPSKRQCGELTPGGTAG